MTCDLLVDQCEGRRVRCPLSHEKLAFDEERLPREMRVSRIDRARKTGNISKK